MKSIIGVLTVLTVMWLPRPVMAQDRAVRSTAEDRQSVAVTIYNENLGLVREVRRLSAPPVSGELEFGDVAARIIPETVHVSSVRGGSFELREQTYRYDLLSPNQLLEKYVGRRVSVHRTNPQTGAETSTEAEVVAVNDDVILRIDGEITYEIPGRLGFPEIPEDLIATPTLMWDVESGGQATDVEVSYLSEGLSWGADYVMVLQDEPTADLGGWVTLENQSGASFENATLKLVAGDVRRVRDRRDRPRPQRAVALQAERADQFAEEELFEYHLYTLQRPTTILNREQKQVRLLEASGIEYERRLVFRGYPHVYLTRSGDAGQTRHPEVVLDFVNNERNHLGVPLPQGIVRVYRADATGALQFLGEDRIDHTPRNETVSLTVGQAFDVVAERLQLEFDQISRCVTQSNWRVDIRNRKSEVARVELIETSPGDWEIIEASHESTRIDARSFRFDLSVAAGNTLSVTYALRVTTC